MSCQLSLVVMILWLIAKTESKSLNIMPNIRVQFTIPDVKKVANLEVKVNGERRNMKFRVVNFEWDARTGSSEHLIDILRQQIENYDNEWELYHIGTPHEDQIPVTFRYQKDQV